MHMPESRTASPPRTKRSKFWRAAAAVFALVNLGGAVVAVARGELLHAGAHVLLLLASAYAVWRLAPSRWVPLPDELSDRFARLEETLDAVAVDVERIGEGQRFMTRFFTENATAGTQGEGAAEPIEIKGPEPESRSRGPG
jgi:hypothetical protein